jgi:hypothetical protein
LLYKTNKNEAKNEEENLIKIFNPETDLKIYLLIYYNSINRVK